MGENEQNVAILALSAALQDNSKTITRQLKGMAKEIEKNAGIIQFGADISDVTQAIESINKIINGKLKGIDVSKQFQGFLDLFSQADRSSEEYLEGLQKIHAELDSLSTLPQYKLDLMKNLNTSQFNKALERLNKANEKSREAAEYQTKMRREAISIEAKSLSELRNKRNYGNSEQYLTSTTETKIDENIKKIGLIKTDSITGEIKKYTELISLFDILQSKKTELDKSEKSVKNAKELIEVNKTLLSLYDEIQNREERLKKKGATNLLSEDLNIETFDKGYIKRNIEGALTNYAEVASSKAKEQAKKAQEEFDRYIEEQSQLSLNRLNKKLEENSKKLAHNKGKQNDSTNEIASAKNFIDNAQNISYLNDTLHVLEQSTSTAENGLKSLNNTIEDTSFSSSIQKADAYSLALKNLGEDFKDVEKYAVDATTAKKEIENLFKILDERTWNKTEETDLMGYAARLDFIDRDTLDNNEELFEIYNDKYGEYIDLINHIDDMTSKQLIEVEKLKQAQEEVSNTIKNFQDIGIKDSSGQHIQEQNKFQQEIQETQAELKKMEEVVRSTANTSAQTSMSDVIEKEQQKFQEIVQNTNTSIEEQLSLIDKLEEKGTDNRPISSNETVPATDLSSEIEGATQLNEALDKVVQNVQNKTEAFKEEENVVSSVIPEELKKVDDLSSSLEKIKDTLGAIKDNTNISININSDNTSSPSDPKKKNANVTNKSKQIDAISQAYARLSKNELSYQKLLNKKNNGVLVKAEDIANLNSLTASREKDLQIVNQHLVLSEKQAKAQQHYNDVVKESTQWIKDFNAANSDNIKNYGRDASNQYFEKIQKQYQTLFANTNNKTPAYAGKLRELNDLIDELKTKLPLTDVFDASEIDGIDRLKKKISNIITELKSDKSYNKVSEITAAKLEKTIQQWSKKNPVAARLFKDELDAIIAKLKTMDSTMDASKLAKQFYTLQATAEKAGKTGLSWFDSWWERIKSLGTYLLSFASFSNLVDLGKQGIGIIHEFDDALTEMNKVSNESMWTLKRYQKESFKTADSIGTTAKAIQNSTADWQRLGEDLQSAAESAKAANVLLNVSEFDNINSATESLVAMSQAYKELDKMDIIDVLNNVGVCPNI